MTIDRKLLDQLAAVEHRPDTYFLFDRFVEVRDDRRSAIELHQAEAPGKPLAEEEVVAMVQDGASQQLSAVGLDFPQEFRRQAFLAGLARRILHRAAVLALLQLEAAHGRRRGEAERDAAARKGVQQLLE